MESFSCTLQSPPLQHKPKINHHPSFPPPTLKHFQPKMSAYWWALRLIQSFEVNSPISPITIKQSLTNSTGPHRRNRTKSALKSNIPEIADQTLQILRQPGFHRAVGKIHKEIHERQYGRNPNQPLAPGEATGTKCLMDWMGTGC